MEKEKKIRKSRVITTFKGGTSKVNRSFTKESDIHTIMDRVIRTGHHEQRRGNPMYGDFTKVHDYGSALLALQEANDNFNALPSNVRTFFENSPEKYLMFIKNKENKEKAIELGLIEPEPPKKPSRVDDFKRALKEDREENSGTTPT